MPGVYGLLMSAANNRAGQIARNLANSMAIYSWERSHTFEIIPDQIYIGLTVRSDDELTGKCCIQHDAGLTCVVDGFIATGQIDKDCDRLISIQHHAEVVCNAYRAYGMDLFSRLTGQFSTIICDARHNRLVAGTSRCGYAPLHVCRNNDSYALATLLGPVASCGIVKTEPDQDAISLFLTYGQYFGQSTPVRGVEVLDAATSMDISFDGSKSQRKTYWNFGQIHEMPSDIGLDQRVDSVCEALLAATPRIVKRGDNIVSGLSGGYDSRLVTTLTAQEIPDIQAWTFGGKNSTDLATAREVCRTLNINHLAYPLEPEVIPEYASNFSATTNGAMTINLAVGLKRCQDLRERANLVLNGVAGDAILGGSMLGPSYKNMKGWMEYRLGRGPRAAHPLLEHNKNNSDIALYIETKYGHRNMLADHLYPRAPLLRDMILGDLDQNYAEVPNNWRTEQWIFHNRVRRWTIMGALSDRSFFADDSHFYDQEVFERSISIPMKWRRGHHAYVKVFKKLIPEVCNIKIGNTGLLPTAPRWRLTMAQLAKKLSSNKCAPTTAANFDDALRMQLKEYYGDLIHSSSVMNRTFWDGRKLQQLFEAHQRNQINCGNELGLVIAAELFLRRWVDRSDAI
ncbi:MAG: asparagine synthase-related protein [Candidatus Latescibacteria bacterium]|nr:asparagine synthase-related protein [Candidatus Latescibacterota bacterium]